MTVLSIITLPKTTQSTVLQDMNTLYTLADKSLHTTQLSTLFASRLWRTELNWTSYVNDVRTGWKVLDGADLSAWLLLLFSVWYDGEDRSVTRVSYKLFGRRSSVSKWDRGRCSEDILWCVSVSLSSSTSWIHN